MVLGKTRFGGFFFRPQKSTIPLQELPQAAIF
jgi:hypothetical protein